jgi:hypothetical protein
MSHSLYSTLVAARNKNSSEKTNSENNSEHDRKRWTMLLALLHYLTVFLLVTCTNQPLDEDVFRASEVDE